MDIISFRFQAHWFKSLSFPQIQASQAADNHACFLWIIVTFADISCQLSMAKPIDFPRFQ